MSERSALTTLQRSGWLVWDGLQPPNKKPSSTEDAVVLFVLLLLPLLLLLLTLLLKLVEWLKKAVEGELQVSKNEGVCCDCVPEVAEAVDDEDSD